MGGKKKQETGPPIFAAIDKGDDELVEQLLKSDPTVKDLRNKDGWTPLISASYCGEADMVRAFISAGADVKASCKDGDTALHYASAQGHMDIIQILAKAGAKLDVKDRDGETPYNVAGKNLKVRKLINDLLNAKLDDSDEAEKEGGGEDNEEEEWEEAGPEEAAAAAAEAVPSKQ